MFVPTRMRRCPSCELAAGPNDRFCEACGARLPELCIGCGEILRAGKPFCHACGRAVPGVAPAQPAAQPPARPAAVPPSPASAANRWDRGHPSQHRTIAYARFLRRVGVVLLDLVWLLPLAIGLRWVLFTYLDQRMNLADLPNERFWDMFTRPEDSERFFLQIAGASLLAVTIFIARGATPGMRIARVRIVDRDGLPPGIVRALVRSIMPALTLVPYIDPAWLPLTSLVGFLYFVSCFTVGFSQKAQTLHDMLAGLYVVEKNPSPRSF